MIKNLEKISNFYLLWRNINLCMKSKSPVFALSCDFTGLFQPVEKFQSLDELVGKKFKKINFVRLEFEFDILSSLEFPKTQLRFVN